MNERNEKPLTIQQQQALLDNIQLTCDPPMTNTRLAELLDVDYATVKRWRNGTSLMSYKTFYRVVELYKTLLEDGEKKCICPTCGRPVYQFRSKSNTESAKSAIAIDEILKTINFDFSGF